MADKLTKKARSSLMSRIRSTDTKPEKQVRSCVHKLGHRYRLYDKKLPGKPDLVLKKSRIVILVHGCFWHFHKRCRTGKLPKSNRKFWKDKFLRNIERDSSIRRRLSRLGWKVVVVWECQTKDPLKLMEKLERVLEKHMNL